MPAAAGHLPLPRSLEPDAPARTVESGEDGFESLVALFARRDGNPRCVRRLFNVLGSAGGRPPAGSCSAICASRWAPERTGRRATRGPGRSQAWSREATRVRRRCGERGGARRSGTWRRRAAGPSAWSTSRRSPGSSGGAHRRRRLQPRRGCIGVRRQGGAKCTAEALGSWDVLLTVASNYYNRKVPDAGAAAAPGGQPEPERRPGGEREPGSDAPRQLRILDRLSSSVLAGTASGSPPTRADSLRLLEEDVARNGPRRSIPWRSCALRR